MGSRTNNRCVRGKIIARQTAREHFSWNVTGDCEGCGRGPLHAPRNTCECSFMRADKRLCRDCAIAFDLITQGHTRISGSPIDPDAWKKFVVIYQQGMSVAEKVEREQEVVQTFEVKVSGYGRPSKVRVDQQATITRALGLAFGAGVVEIKARAVNQHRPGIQVQMDNGHA